MEQSMDLSALGGQQIDPETFRRVWARVMPNQESSPIAVEPAAPPVKAKQTAAPMPQASAKAPAQMAPKTPPQVTPKAAPRTAPMPPQPKAAAPRPETKAVQPRPAEAAKETRTDEERLQGLMDLAQEGFARCQTLVRRAGKQSQALSGLAADHRRALRQLAAAHFLATGRRYQPKGLAPVLNSVLILALREQFLWEQRWARACLQAAEETADRDLQDLCRELAQDAALHNRTIRGVLERI